jgi:hypothetical protein
VKAWQEYCKPSKWHEAANIFPLVPAEELQTLADDIKTTGMKNPIVLLDDKVLDGRNRLLACKLVGVTPLFESRTPENIGSPVQWVLSQNLHRRHINKSQLAFIAVEAEKIFAVEAERRRLSTLKQGTKAPVKAKIPEREQGQARDKAAAACGVSPSYVSAAKDIAARAPEVAAKVKAGTMTMAEAKAVTKPAPSAPVKPVALSPHEKRAAELHAFAQTLWSTAATVTVCRKLSGFTPFHFNLEIDELEEEDLRAAMTAASESRKQRVKKALAKRGKS